MMLLPIGFIAIPSIAYAQTVSRFVGFFNVFAGVMLVASLIAFVAGFGLYLVRLGTVYRKDGLDIMVWGIAILFVLVVLLGIAQIIQHFFT
jgi:hypothetical protein